MRASGYGIALALLVVGAASGGSSSGGPRGTLAVVAEAEHESGGINYPTNIYVVDVDGTHLRNLTHDGASNVSAEWMPDGRRIVFQSHPSNTDRGTWHIFAINSDGTHRRRLTSRIGGRFPDISPDGRRIAFVIQRRRKWDVYVMDSDGRHQRRLRTPHNEWEVDLGPMWTPDGRMIFFVRFIGNTGASSLYLINADGTGLTRLARLPFGLIQVAWSPTGRTLAIDQLDPSTVGGADRLTISDLRRDGVGLVLRPVKTIRNVPGAFQWAPDGRTIIYENDAGTWVVDARRPQPRRRFPVQAYVYNLTWSPDRRWLAFSRLRGFGEGPIEVATAAGRERRTVTRKICCLLDEIAWAPR